MFKFLTYFTAKPRNTIIAERRMVLATMTRKERAIRNEFVARVDRTNS